MDEFVLDEERADQWLVSAIVAREMGDVDEVDMAASSDLPPVGMAWRPSAVGEEDTAFLLVHAAQQAGVLVAPAGVHLRFELLDDGDDGIYRFLVDIAAPVPLTLASAAEEMRLLGEPGTTGLAAAMGLLREAVEVANLLLERLSAFITATSDP